MEPLRHTIMSLASVLAFAAGLSASPVSALELPKPQDAKAQALLARTALDLPKLEAGWNFARPPAQDWPCAAPIGHLYLAAGLIEALKPEQLPEGIKSMDELRKSMRRSFREAGLQAGMPTTEFSNIVLVPVKAACANGKLEGETEFYVSYESSMESKVAMFSQATKKMEDVRSITRQAIEKRVRAVFEGGKPNGVQSDFTRGTMTTQVLLGDPALQKAAVAVPPTAVRSASYQWPDGQVMMNTIPSVDATAGFLSPNVKISTALMTIIMLAEDKGFRMFTYSNGELSGVSRMNTATNTMASVTYTENVYKKLGVKRTEMPGTENQKEVVINGKEMLEQHMCIINGAPAKVDPCPVD
jgi:hypothetical protein